MPATIRVGILGTASIARRRMLPAFAASPDFAVAAVASRDPDRAAGVARTYGCDAVHGYQALLDRTDVDAVYLPLPTAMHAGWAEAALRAGKHVLVEKPAAEDAAKVAALLRLARDKGLALRENVLFVHHGQHSAVRDLMAGGAVGELRAFHATFTVPAPPATDIRHDAALGGGALADVGVYPVRAALHLLGPELEVAGATLRVPPGSDVETGGAALLTTSAGVTVQLSFGMDHDYRSGYEVHGSTGRITVRHAFTPPAGHRPDVLLTRGAGSAEAINLPAEDQVAAAVSAFAAAVRGRAAPDDALAHQARLLDEIRRAAHPAAAQTAQHRRARRGATTAMPHEPAEMPPSARLLQLATAGWMAQAVCAAAELGVADELATSPRPVSELAAAVDADADALYRLMSACADVGVFTESPGRVFALTEVGQSLRTDGPASMRHFVRWTGLAAERSAWTGLATSVRTGRSSFADAHGSTVWEYLARDATVAGIFDQAMTEVSAQVIGPVVAAYDFSAFGTVVDVGGGQGGLLAAVLAANPGVRGILYDRPEVVAGAGHRFKEAGVSDRCELRGGDFFAGVPAGGDAYLLSNILHDWDDEYSLRILGHCRDAMAAGGRVLLVEAVLPEDGGASPTVKFMDLDMLVVCDGRQRSASAFRDLFARAGLTLGRVVPGGLCSVVEAFRSEPAKETPSC